VGDGKKARSFLPGEMARLIRSVLSLRSSHTSKLQVKRPRNDESLTNFPFNLSQAKILCFHCVTVRMKIEFPFSMP